MRKAELKILKKKHGKELAAARDEGGQCAACLDRFANVLLFPCKHLATCEACLQAGRDADPEFSCPICREPIADTTLCYLN